MPDPIVLEGRFVRLEPLTLGHAPGLLDAAAEPDIWVYLMVPPPSNIHEMEGWIEAALEQQTLGHQLPFVILDRETGFVLGTTRYLDIRMADRSVEIGWTWLAKSAWRTAINSECKLLLMRHAFETLGFQRVQLKTDARNARSRAAIERIGGQFEGILRKYQRYWHGLQRDTAIYSILADEWPNVRQALERKLEGAGPGQ